MGIPVIFHYCIEVMLDQARKTKPQTFHFKVISGSKDWALHQVFEEIYAPTGLDFQKKILGPPGLQVFIFGHQDKYSSRQKLSSRKNRI